MTDDTTGKSALRVHRRNWRRLAAAAGVALGLACGAPGAKAQTPVGSAAGQQHMEEIVRGLHRGVTVREAAISPDGKRLAWVEGGRSGGIRVAWLDDLKKIADVTAATRTNEECREGDVIWEPDSKAVAFFSDCAGPGGQLELYIEKLDGSPAHRLTRLTGYVHDPAFSPDGKQVAFLYVEGATRPAGALAAMKPPSGVIGEDDVEVQRVAVAQVAAPEPKAPRQVTPATLHVFEFDWSPDSRGLAYVAADPPGENNWWVARLYAQQVGGDAKAIVTPSKVTGPLHGLQVAVPRWSPDGKTIAFVGGLMSDQGVTGGDVWIVNAGGGQPRDLTAGRRTTPAWLEWADDGHLFVDEIAGGDCQLVRYTLRGNPLSEGGTVSFGKAIFSVPGTVGDGRRMLSLSSTADRGMFVFSASTFDHPAELYAVKASAPSAPGLSGLTQLTALNAGVKPVWGRAVSLTWANEGYRIQGWLMLPGDYQPERKYPLIVEVHGGPASAVLPRWGAEGGLSAAAFSAMGYFVLQPNPRGSFGQGEAFTKANRKDFGYGDLRDILAGVDAVLARYPVDPNRVGITGWSYGGFMTMFAVTQTHRFKAAVAGAGLSDWLSYYGENSIDQWMIPYFGAPVYDDPAVYAKSSAINYIKQAKTPTLVVVGDRDGECPAPQSYEFWHGLRDQHVPTQLVVYPNEGHGFVNPAHRIDVMERAVRWFDRYMPPSR